MTLIKRAVLATATMASTVASATYASAQSLDVLTWDQYIRIYLEYFPRSVGM
jgi:spermidine/putrescine-binding protein